MSCGKGEEGLIASRKSQTSFLCELAEPFRFLCFCLKSAGFKLLQSLTASESLRTASDDEGKCMHINVSFAIASFASSDSFFIDLLKGIAISDNSYNLKLNHSTPFHSCLHCVHAIGDSTYSHRFGCRHTTGIIWICVKQIYPVDLI